MAFVNNYSTSFRYLDFIFGTDDKYRAHVAKVRAMKGKVSEAERKEAERRMLEETEREGAVAEAAAEQRGSAWSGAKGVKAQ